MSKKGLALQFLVIVLLLAMAAPALADGGVQVTLTADKSELTVGDPVQLTLEVTHPAGYQVIIPKLEQTWGAFEVRGQSQAETTSNDDGTATTRAAIEVTLFDLGTFETPALPLTISDGAGQVSEEMAPPVSLTVLSVLAEDDTTLEDIKPQASLAVSPVWPSILAGLLITAAVVGSGWWVYRRWRGNRQPGLASVIGNDNDNRPPHQVAYDELARIEGLQLPEQARFKEHYTLVADCLRTYLENQFHVRAFDRTTFELKLVLRRTDISPDNTRRFIRLFTESDLVKFAKLTPDLETARQLTGHAHRLVDLTRPKPEVEAPAGPVEQTGNKQPVASVAMP